MRTGQIYGRSMSWVVRSTFLTALLSLSACGSGWWPDTLGGSSQDDYPTASTNRAPVGAQTVGVHQVRRGETVYSLARRYGSTPSAIAQANRLGPNYAISVGQTLVIPRSRAPQPPSAGDPLPPSPHRAPRLASPHLGATQTSGPSRRLAPPVDGQIVTPFGARLGTAQNDGVDIAARPGSVVRAAMTRGWRSSRGTARRARW